jgi:nucleotide-binding universal stress UspA family protein
MDVDKKFVVVPWDFSEESEHSLSHAIQLARVMGNGIVLFNIIHVKKGWFKSVKGISAEQENQLRQKMEAKAKDIQETNNLETRVVLKQGDVAKMVPAEVKGANANLVVMPFHYKFGAKILKGSEFSKAMKEAIVPFIVVKKPPRHKYYKELVIPIDHDKKYKETIAWIIYLAHYYRCNVNIIKPFITDDFMKKDMANNIYFTKKMLDKQNIIYGIKTAKKKQSFKSEIFRFSELIDADIIVMMAKQYQKWIDNDDKLSLDTPIMIVPPRSDLIKYGSFS